MKKIHYAPSGEWGGNKTSCNKYYNSDVLTTGYKEDITCGHCINSITPPQQ